MRDLSDLIKVRFSISGSLEMDWERLEQDPEWQRFAERYDLADPEQKKEAVTKYMISYLSDEQILATMPVTNGPADLYGINVEVLGPLSTEGKKEQ